MEHLQWVWHASRENLSFLTPGSVALLGNCLCSNSSILPYLYSTFHLEYPLVLSRFCLYYWKPHLLKNIWMKLVFEISTAPFAFYILSTPIFLSLTPDHWTSNSFVNDHQHFIAFLKPFCYERYTSEVYNLIFLIYIWIKRCRSTELVVSW